jgi:hypothetical protein
MSASHASTLDAIALQLAAALDTYERDVDAMVASWLDMDLYSRVSDEVEEIRMYCAALMPQLSVHWAELLIAHAELVHSLWRLRFREDAHDGERLRELRARHDGCLQSLRTRCLRFLARSEADSP